MQKKKKIKQKKNNVQKRVKKNYFLILVKGITKDYYCKWEYVVWRDSWDGFIVFIFICIVSYGALQSSQKYHLKTNNNNKKKQRRSDSDSSRRPTNQHQAGEEEEAEPRQTRSNCPGHDFRTLYVSIYNIFPYFLYILNICLTVFTFCSTNRGLLWLCG